MDIEHIQALVKKQLSTKRYEHTIRVTETAVKLAKKYKVDLDDVRIAALLHDYAKDMEKHQLQSYIKEFNLPVDLLDYDSELWHGPVAAKLAENQFNIKKKPILQAIYHHTTGRAYMDDLELIVFVADFIEPARNFPAVHGVREEAEENLRLAARSAVKNTIMFLLTKNVSIHPDTFLAYNHLTKTMGVK